MKGFLFVSFCEITNHIKHLGSASAWLDDGCLARFLLARENDVDKAFEMLCHAVEWRLTNKPELLSTQADAELAAIEALGFVVKLRVFVCVFVCLFLFLFLFLPLW